MATCACVCNDGDGLAMNTHQKKVWAKVEQQSSTIEIMLSVV